MMRDGGMASWTGREGQESGDEAVGAAPKPGQSFAGAADPSAAVPDLVAADHCCEPPAIDRGPFPPDRSNWECGVCGRRFRYDVRRPRDPDEIAQDVGSIVRMLDPGWIETKGPVR